MSIKLLLTDNRNALGSALEHELERESINLLVPGDQLDWRDPDSIADYVRRTKPDLVINSRAWEDTPNEQQRQELPRIAAALANACVPGQVPLIQFSSYKVFGAANKSIHNEKDLPAPLSDVGRVFLATERALEVLDKHICLRLSWVVGSYGENLLTRLLNNLLLHTGEPVSVSERLKGAPTPLSDVARVAVALVKQVSCGAENWGVMHYCTGESCTEAEFANQVIQTLQQLNVLKEAVKLPLTDVLPDKEPVSAVLSCRRVRDYFGVQSRAWRPTLMPMIKQWLHNHRDQL